MSSATPAQDGFGHIGLAALLPAVANWLHPVRMVRVTEKTVWHGAEAVRDRVAELTGLAIASATVCRWASTGCHGRKLVAQRVGRALLVAESDLRRFLGIKAEVR